MTAPVAGSVPAPARLPAQVGRMLLLFAPQLAIAPVLFFVAVTFLHESAHAVMAIALGGKIKEFAFLPGAGALGHVRWEPPPHAAPWMGDAVSVAPYLMWSMFAAAVILLAFRRVRLNRWLAAAIFFWSYFIPIGDIAWNLYGGRGDLAVGGFDGLVLQAIGTLAIAAAYVLGFFVQRRLFAERAVGVLGYLSSSFAIGAASAVAGVIGLLAFTGKV
jgi:hypothetical protein